MQAARRNFHSNHITQNGTIERSDILLEGFLLPSRNRDTGAFEKISIRGSVDFPTVNFAGAYCPRPSARLLVGAVADNPVELHDTTDFIFAGRTRTWIKYGDSSKELLSKSKLIKESTISVKVKRFLSKYPHAAENPVARRKV
ncbi:MAG: hypothetical protein ACLRMZ_20265 [Blautia marasmi]